jgi:hypothetical protein
MHQKYEMNCDFVDMDMCPYIKYIYSTGRHVFEKNVYNDYMCTMGLLLPMGCGVSSLWGSTAQSYNWSSQ